MKNPLEVLRMKEQDMLRVKQEIEALRITAKLLGEETPSNGEGKGGIRQVVNLP
jgi:hypothetical protein